MRNRKGYTTNEVISSFILVIIFFGLIGWMINFYKLTQLDFKEPYKAEVLRVIGIIPPAGAIMGYLEIEDK